MLSEICITSRHVAAISDEVRDLIT
ncbi:hypothetical protein CITRIK5_50314 [Citricoccus sp. K5]|nr:hypothetical protein CITRIK5_50314 [Citricoccus sp. K5]